MVHISEHNVFALHDVVISNILVYLQISLFNILFSLIKNLYEAFET